MDEDLETAGVATTEGPEDHRDDGVPAEVRWFVLGARTLITARALTQAQVAKALGGGAPYLSNVLSLDPGRMRKFRFHYACLVAKALDTDLIELLELGRRVEKSPRRGEERENSREP